MFSESQQVVVIDDDYDEIKQLLAALWQKGIPYIYLDGQQDNLPQKPFSGVRLLFLDIVIGLEGSSDKNTASSLANVVSKIIGPNPGPYFIVFWTKHNTIIDEVLRYLKSGNMAPVGYSNLDKPTNHDNGTTISELMERLEERFLHLDAFDYLLNWESLIGKAVHNFSASLFSINSPVEDNATWSKRIKSLLGTLALSNTEKSDLENTVEDIKNAFLNLTDSFKDSLQQIIKTEKLNYNNPLSKEQLSPNQKAKINSSLFIDFNPANIPALGNVFFSKHASDVHLRESLINYISPKIDKPDEVILIGMIITPSCDLVNKKYLHNEKDCFRILYGLLIPVNECKYKRKGDADFVMRSFWYKEKIYQLIFHFGSLTSLWWKKDEIPEFKFAIKEHLAFDIQSKMANHANRLGNSML
ncbi:hypothetical protein AGMMS50268_29160 [Spirochaetia bacterium]|nr:hypothetical protein AGMMS50268_29160 [Spirochaetia bacterium]